MKNILFVAFLLLNGSLIAQTGSAKQVKWTFSAKKMTDKTYEVKFSAIILDNFHLYAQKPGVEGPVPTSFNFSVNPLFALSDKVKEVGKPIKKFESAWDGTVTYFEKNVDFIQVIKLKSNVKTNLTGSVEFMVCNDSQCLPPTTVPFKIALGN
jgi:thiol:disulfide interchange protein DsbD